MIHPTKADIGRTVAWREFQTQQGVTVVGTIVAFDAMLVLVLPEGGVDTVAKNRVDLEWVGD